MTTSKQKAIQAAYGDAWEKVKEHVDNDGWCCGIHPIKAGCSEDYDWSQGCWRPKGLSGIDSNNGWIRCDKGFPEGDGSRQVKIWDGKKERNFSIRADSVQSAYEKAEPFTHWKYVEEVKPPIY